MSVRTVVAVVAIMNMMLVSVYNDAGVAHRKYGPEGAGDWVKRQKVGSRSNPLAPATVVGVGILAGAVHGVVEPHLIRHVYAVGAEPVGTMADPSAEPAGRLVSRFACWRTAKTFARLG